MFNLKRCREAIHDGAKEPNDLFWDSWDRHHHTHHRSGASPRTHRSAVARYHQQQQQLQQQQNQLHNRLNPIDSIVNSPIEISPPDSISQSSERHSSAISPEDGSVSMLTPSPSPPNSPLTQNNKQKTGKGFPTTPPPKKKHQTLITVNSTVQQTSPPQIINNNSTNDQIPLTKSKSHESQLVVDGNVNQNNLTNNANTTTTTIVTTRSRLHTEPGPDHHYPLQNELTEHLSTNNLTVPRSPCTPIVTRSMGHQIQHRFTKKFKVSTCDLCQKQMFFGLKCKECKYRCHKDCELHVPPSCGLPQEYVDVFKRTLQSDVFQPTSSPNMLRQTGFLHASNLLPHHHKSYRARPQIPYHGGPDSSSAGSSCNSSSPSSPALLQNPPQTPATSKHTQFNFPEVSGNHIERGDITLETHPIEPQEKIQIIRDPISPRPIKSELADTHQSNDSDKTVSNGSTTASTDSDRTPVRLDSTEERDSVDWPRQNSLSLKEWDIPYDELKLIEKIGRGRFGTVHRALWHGDVAVKLLKEDYLGDDRTLEAFKLEVAIFRKTRHENVVLFMGACMKPPRLAIVTSLCKGNTLYTHIHSRKDKFNLNRTTLVAQQISQGMGYLHARDIVHKDLKTKNIFLENGKVIITDFGLFSATKLCYCEIGLGIPQGWLCYLAPELMKNLKPCRPTNEDLPFSKASDIFAFGTVWYELLCGEFPFKSQPSEAIIWQVGRGMKQTLANLQATRDVKDISMLCWSFQTEDRPEFSKLLINLEKLPKKRLARSPSHPVQLSRSAESVF